MDAHMGSGHEQSHLPELCCATPRGPYDPRREQGSRQGETVQCLVCVCQFAELRVFDGAEVAPTQEGGVMAGSTKPPGPQQR